MSKKIGIVKENLDRLRESVDKNKMFLRWVGESHDALILQCLTTEARNKLKEYWLDGYDEGEKMDMSMGNKNLKTFLHISGEQQGKELNMEQRQSDDESQSPEGGMMAIAMNAWFEWSENNDLRRADVDLKKYELMRDALIDGYLNGFTKRITG